MVRATALAIFAAALVCRLLFWRATPDRDWAWTAFFKGDAPLWLEYARAIDLENPFELGLPIHPPGAAWLVSLLWNELPSGVPFLRFAWALLGALVPLLVFLAVRRSFSLRAATFAGVWTALSTGLLVLSTSVNNETPYLVLAVGALWFIEDLRERPSIGRLVLWSAVNAVACLFRVEHVLFYVFALVFFAIGWMRVVRRRESTFSFGRGAKWAAVSLLFFALPLVPWHLSAWGAIRRFNEEPRQLTPVEESAVAGVEKATSDIPWNEEALRRREELPGFARRTGAAFVLATAAHRGRRTIGAEEFRTLEEAFGYYPRPLARFPFISSYGPLNFYLANNSFATEGFNRRPLEEPPPLGGGAASYPRFLVQGLPPGDLSFVYPPHLRLFNEGYALGWEWIRRNPGEFARLAARKLSIFWSGAAMGFTGWNLPLGLSGPRRAVDMVAPENDPVWIGWRVAVLAICAGGLVAAWRHAALTPLLLFLASKIAATVLFFGYVRQGALVIPVVAILAGLAAERWVPARPAPRGRGRVPRFATAVLLIGIAVEGARFFSRPAVRIDGLAIGEEDPFPPDDHRARRVEVE